MKSLQTLLGDHQDSVMVRGALRELATEAHEAGENAFTYGVLYGRAGSARRPWRRSCRGVGGDRGQGRRLRRTGPPRPR